MKSWFFSLMVMAILLFSNFSFAQLPPSYIPNSGLVAWWPFNGNANDESGNGNNGTAIGATLTTDRNGISNAAYNFDGISNYISGNIANLTNTSILTLSAWLNYTGNAGGQPYDFYFQYGIFGQHTFAYGYNYPSQTLDIFSSCFSNPYFNFNLNNAWHHVVVVDSLTSTRIYIDGVEVNSWISGSTTNCYQGTNLFLIGGGADNQFVTGKLDDIAIWDRALSPCEIKHVFESGDAGLTLSVNPTSFCLDDAMGILTGFPANGTWTGPGVSGNSFSPISAGVGVHNVIYTLTDSIGGSNSDSLQITVDLCTGTLQSSETTTQLFVFPNPANGEISVTLNKNLLGTYYVITDQFEKMVMTGNLVSEKTSIDLSELSDGVYLFTIGEYSKQVLRVIKD